jgi:hypothetical protein
MSDNKFKHYIIFVPPVFGASTAVPAKYPMPGESYNYKQAVDVLSIFDKRWKSSGSVEGKEPYALSSSKTGIEDADPVMLTRDGVYSEMAGDAYIEAVAEKESSNLLLNELLRLDCSMDDPDDLDDEGTGGAGISIVKPQGGGKTCRKEKATKTEKRNPKK